MKIIEIFFFIEQESMSFVGVVHRQSVYPSDINSKHKEEIDSDNETASICTGKRMD